MMDYTNNIKKQQLPTNGIANTGLNGFRSSAIGINHFDGEKVRNPQSFKSYAATTL